MTVTSRVRVRRSRLAIGVAGAIGVAAIGCAAFAADPPGAGDPVKGKVVFAKCGICHVVDPGKTKIGPTLAGLVGRRSGSVPGFTYSAAMKASNLVWTPANLDKYLTKPSAMVPGNVMYFPGLASADDRANVIAYLKDPSKVK